MAWEWVAPLATAGGVSVVAVTAWLTAKGGRDQAERMAHEARRQERFADAYVELLTLVERSGQWSQLVRPFLDTGGELPPLPDLAEQARARALVNAYGSPAAKELFEQYRSAVAAIVLLDAEIGDVIEMGSGASEFSRGELWRKLDQELRPREVAVRASLSEQVATELASPSHARAERDGYRCRARGWLGRRQYSSDVQQPHRTETASSGQHRPSGLDKDRS